MRFGMLILGWIRCDQQSCNKPNTARKQRAFSPWAQGWNIQNAYSWCCLQLTSAARNSCNRKIQLVVCTANRGCVIKREEINVPKHDIHILEMLLRNKCICPCANPNAGKQYRVPDKRVSISSTARKNYCYSNSMYSLFGSTDSAELV